MQTVHVLSPPLDEVRRAELVFAGDLLIFKSVAPMAELCDLADALVREAFGALDPETAHEHMEREAYLAAAASLRARFKGDAEARRLFAATLAHIGVDAERGYWDWPTLRILPVAGGPSGRRVRSIPFHRDTWGSNLMQQVNWWAPVHPLTAERTIAFYPRYWSTPIANSSAEWDIEELRARRRQAGPGAQVDYPLLPEAREPVDTASELRLVMEPGDVLCFSGAQGHASVPNTSGAARFSVEVRTVGIDDVLAGRGAPNVDGRTTRAAVDWFRRISDGMPLAEALAAAAGKRRHTEVI